jgi:bicarbonate transport system substrate-binding protein
LQLATKEFMAEFSNQFSRRKFLLRAGASAVGSVFLKGCLGNPPDTANTIQTKQVAAITVSAADRPETTTVKLGYIPLLKLLP